MSGRWLRWLLSLTRGVGRPDHGPTRLTILRHHRVYADAERPLYRLGVAETVLDRQLALLAEVGLAPLTVRDGLAHLAADAGGHRVALSFDDGYRDNVRRALPLLARHGGQATFYLTAGLIEERVAPWWDTLAHLLGAPRLAPRAAPAWAGAAPLAWRDETGRARVLTRLLPCFRVDPATRSSRLTELARTLGTAEPAPCELATWEECVALTGSGMEVGAHTLHHPHLTTLTAAAQRDEIAGSLELVARRLGVTHAGFAYPGGDHDATTVGLVRALGVAHAVTTRAGDNRAGADPLALRRRGFSEGTCLDPAGRFSRRLALAEMDGAFDRLRGVDDEVAA